MIGLWVLWRARQGGRSRGFGARLGSLVDREQRTPRTTPKAQACARASIALVHK